MFPNSTLLDFTYLGKCLVHRLELKRKIKKSFNFFSLFRYLKYGQGSKRCPIQNVLESTLSFVLSTPPSGDELNSDVDMKTPISGSPTPTPMNTTSSIPSPCPLSEVRWSPAPRNVTESEVAVLEECLRRWKLEMEQDVKGAVFGLLYVLKTHPVSLFLLKEQGVNSCTQAKLTWNE